MADKDFSNEVKVEDGEDYKGEVLGIKGIALEQYRRCCVEGSKEMKRGGISNRIISGQLIEVEIPDQREIFMNSVKLLEIVLAPELLKKDQDEFIKRIDDVDKKIKELQKNSEETINECMGNYEKGNKTKPTKYNTNSMDQAIKTIKDDTDSKLVFLFQSKLIILSMKLKDLNYFDEGIAGGY